MLGNVKFFSADKGFGFIIGDDKQQYFVHFKEIVSEGYKTLNADDRVEFICDKSPKGLVAKNVMLIREY